MILTPGLCRAGQRTMGISRADGLAAPLFVPGAEQFHPGPDPTGRPGRYHSPASLYFFGSPAIAYVHAEATLIIDDLALLVLPRTRARATCAKLPASPTGVHPWRPLLPGVSSFPAKVPSHPPGYDEVAGEVPRLLGPVKDPNSNGEQYFTQEAYFTPILRCQHCETTGEGMAGGGESDGGLVPWPCCPKLSQAGTVLSGRPGRLPSKQGGRTAHA